MIAAHTILKFSLLDKLVDALEFPTTDGILPMARGKIPKVSENMETRVSMSFCLKDFPFLYNMQVLKRLEDWTSPIFEAIRIRNNGNDMVTAESPFVNPVPERMTMEQIDVSMKAQILRRATMNLQSLKLSNIVFNFELLGLAIMWYGQVGYILHFITIKLGI
jgi:hypothetical protein